MQFIGPDGVYPKTIHDVMELHPDWFPGAGSLPEGWTEVLPVPVQAPPGQKPVEGEPEERDGQFYQTWTYEDLTEEEQIEANAPFTARDKLLEMGFNKYEVRAILGPIDYF